MFDVTQQQQQLSSATLQQGAVDVETSTPIMMTAAYAVQENKDFEDEIEEECSCCFPHRDWTIVTAQILSFVPFFIFFADFDFYYDNYPDSILTVIFSLMCIAMMIYICIFCIRSKCVLITAGVSALINAFWSAFVVEIGLSNQQMVVTGSSLTDKITMHHLIVWIGQFVVWILVAALTLIFTCGSRYKKSRLRSYRRLNLELRQHDTEIEL